LNLTNITTIELGERERDHPGGQAMELAFWILGGWLGLSVLTAPLIGGLGRVNEGPAAGRREK